MKLHASTVTRIAQLRDTEACNSQRVKIAILDSGIELSQSNLDLYNNNPEIVYKSWIEDDNPEWKDEAGHGTHLSVLLRQIAPDAVIFVGRVFRRSPTQDSGSKIANVSGQHSMQ
jgi:hypothetical protein